MEAQQLSFDDYKPIRSVRVESILKDPLSRYGRDQIMRDARASAIKLRLDDSVGPIVGSSAFSHWNNGDSSHHLGWVVAPQNPQAFSGDLVLGLLYHLFHVSHVARFAVPA